jgi:acyl carrier protein
MDNLEQRLENVFATVFPDLPRNKITMASQDSVETWDSVAAITLLNLIEEEFGVQMEFEDIGDLTSFSSIAEYLKGKLSHTAA